MLQSASRLVLILLSLALVGALFGRIVDPKDFMSVVIMVFAFYFTKPVDKSTDDFIK